MGKEKLEVLGRRKDAKEEDSSELRIHTEDRKTAEQGHRQAKPERSDASLSIIGPNEAAFEAQGEAGRTSPGSAAASERTVTKRRKPEVSQAKPQPPPESQVTRPKPVAEGKTPDPPDLPPRPVAMSKGVAYLQGNMIRLIGGIKLRPGDQIRIGDRELILRAGKKGKTWIYPAAAAVLVVVLLLISSLFGSGHDAALIGMITEANTGEIVPDVTVHLKELDKTVRSNDLGFFFFESLPAGSYVLTVTSDGHEPKVERVSIAEDQPLTLRVNLTPLLPDQLASASADEASAAKKSGGSKKSSSPGTTGSTLGAVKIKSNVSDPTILIDNRLAGIGNDLFRDVQPGEHVVAVTKEGYYDWAKQVDVKPGKILTLKVTLSQDKTGHPDAQTWKDFVALGNAQLNANDLPSALNSYNQALDLKPDSPDALLGRGYTHQKMGDKSKAVSDFKRSAELFQSEHDYRNAALSYGNLLGLDDRAVEGYLNRGICYLGLGEYKSSISDLKKAAEIDPNSLSGHLNLGEAYLRAGDYEHSVDCYKRAQKIDSDNHQVLVGLTRAYYKKGDKSKARKSYKEFEKLSTYIYREKLKDDPEWREMLEALGVGS